jgi:hypothetical protein
MLPPRYHAHQRGRRLRPAGPLPGRGRGKRRSSAGTCRSARPSIMLGSRRFLAFHCGRAAPLTRRPARLPDPPAWRRVSLPARLQGPAGTRRPSRRDRRGRVRARARRTRPTRRALRRGARRPARVVPPGPSGANRPAGPAVGKGSAPVEVPSGGRSMMAANSGWRAASTRATALWAAPGKVRALPLSAATSRSSRRASKGSRKKRRSIASPHRRCCKCAATATTPTPAYTQPRAARIWMSGWSPCASRHGPGSTPYNPNSRTPTNQMSAGRRFDSARSGR